MNTIKPMAPPMKRTTSPKKFATKIHIRFFLRFAISDVTNALSGKKSKNPPVGPIKARKPLFPPEKTGRPIAPNKR